MCDIFLITALPRYSNRNKDKKVQRENQAIKYIKYTELNRWPPKMRILTAKWASINGSIFNCNIHLTAEYALSVRSCISLQLAHAFSLLKYNVQSFKRSLPASTKKRTFLLDLPNIKAKDSNHTHTLTWSSCIYANWSLVLWFYINSKWARCNQMVTNWNEWQQQQTAQFVVLRCTTNNNCSTASK